MDYEPWNPPNDTEEINRRYRQRKEEYVAWLRQIGEEIEAAPVAIMITPPGVAFSPVVYQRHRDDGYLLLLGHRDEVAGTEDPEAVRRHARYRVQGTTETVGAYAVKQPYDLAQALREQTGFYTPEGYLDLRPYNPETDPPLIPELGH